MFLESIERSGGGEKYKRTIFCYKKGSKIKQKLFCCNKSTRSNANYPARGEQAYRSWKVFNNAEWKSEKYRKQEN